MKADYDYHSYFFRSCQPFHVVLRHLHHFIQNADIINNLSELGHKVISVSNIFHRTNKSLLSLFNINLARNNSNGEIFEITKILNSIVKFDYSISPLGSQQCHSCQMRKGTRNYYYHPLRCVKCRSNHFTNDYIKTW